MPSYFKATKAQRESYRSNWMNEFSLEVCRLDVKHTGKIDWDSAAFYFNSGVHPDDAALKYVVVRSDDATES
jgi:hypothetical protein